MAAVDEEDVIEDDHFSAVLNFPPEVQEAIDQVCTVMSLELWNDFWVNFPCIGLGRLDQFEIELLFCLIFNDCISH